MTIGSDRMTLPKIEFKIMTLKDNIDLIKWAYFVKDETLSLHDCVINYFKELDNIDLNLSNEEIKEIIEKVVTDKYKKNENILKSEVNRYNDLWKKYNDKYFETLSSYLNIEWPKNISIINATVGLIPVFPRYLDDFSFSIGTGVDDLKLLEVCAHETLHFLWFEKWKKLHPEIPRREYDSPYLVWQYSEMVTDPILNNKPFSDMFEFTEHGYDSFYELKDGNEKVMDKLRKIYSTGKSTEEKIENGFKYINSIFKK